MTQADRALMAAHRHRDRCAERTARWEQLLRVVLPGEAWARERYGAYAAALRDAERTLAELERAAGVPISADEGR